MAVKRFRRRFRRRRNLKRKMRFAMKSGTKLTRYDGAVYAKFITRGYVVADATPNNASLGIGWGSNGASGTH